MDSARTRAPFDRSASPLAIHILHLREATYSEWYGDASSLSRGPPMKNLGNASREKIHFP